MKTLRQYVVNGGLYAGDGKTPAAVGDQVRLYLDTEAHSDFPEYIVGTIQHPVAPILSGTAISYSFEYDEADLDDVVANLIVADVVSVTVTSAVDIVAEELDSHIGAGGAAHANVIAAGAAGFMTGADKTKLDAITGTNTGNETTASVLALLEDVDLEVASIGLTDGTGTALAAGRLSLNANGDPVVHDFESNAEDLPYLVNSRESINFATRVLAASMDNVTLTRKLADINLPASFIANGKLLYLFGDTFAAWSAGNKPNFETRMVLCKEGAAPATSGIHFFVGMGAWSEAIRFQIPFVFNVSTGVSTLNTALSRPAGISTFNDDGTITSTASIADSLDFFVESVITGLAGEPLKLDLYLFTKDTTDAVTADLYLSGNLSVISQ